MASFLKTYLRILQTLHPSCWSLTYHAKQLNLLFGLSLETSVYEMCLDMSLSNLVSRLPL